MRDGGKPRNGLHGVAVLAAGLLAVLGLSPTRGAQPRFVHDAIRFSALAAADPGIKNQVEIGAEARIARHLGDGPVRSEEDESVPRMLVVPPETPGPRRAPVTPAGRYAGTARGPQPMSPSTGASFQGVGDNISYIPPDTHGTVGPNHIVTSVNSQFRIQDRSGGAISIVNLSSFWSGTGTNFSDPRTIYDPYSDRWISAVMSDSFASTSSVNVAVTQTGDPTGVWNRYRFDADPANSSWCDYPTLGFNKDWIVASCNMFGNSSPYPFGGSRVFAMHKANLYANASETPVVTALATSYGATLQPAVTYDNSLGTEYLLETWNGNSAGFGYIRIYSIGSSGSVSVGPLASIANTWDYGSGSDFAPQLGSSSKIDAGDDRMMNAVYRNGSLWGAQTAFIPAGGPTRSVAQWWQLTPAGSVQQFGRIDDGSHFTAYPTIAVNKDNDVLLGYTRFGSSQYASANYAFRYASDPVNTVQADIVAKAGEAPYYKTYGGPRNRWGDYSSTQVDPANDTDMWTVQEYAWTHSGSYDRWGTWWTQVVTGTAGTPAASVTPSSVSFGDQVTGSTSPVHTVTVTNTGTASLVVSTATIAGTNASEFSKTADSCSGHSVAPSANCTIDLRFSPTATGARTATLSIATNAAGSPTVVPLDGNGIPPPPAPIVSFSPSPLTFGARAVGSTSPPQALTVTNTGNADLNVLAVTITGANAAEFAKSADSCTGATVVPSASCSIDVTFTPALDGVRSASVQLDDNAAGSPHLSSVSGTGIGTPAASVSPANLTFPDRAIGSQSPAQTVTVQNPGTAGLVVSSVSLAGANPGDFVKVGDACSGTTVTPTSSCVVQVAFKPTASGARAATLRVNDNATSSPQTVSLSGNGLTGVPGLTASPSTLSFGPIAVGATKTMRTTLTNNGTATNGPLSTSLTGGGFSVTSDNCNGVTLAVNARCTIDVAFAPLSSGGVTGALSVASSAPGSPTRVTLSGTGDGAAPVSQFYTATNAVIFGSVRTVDGASSDDISGVAKVTLHFTSLLNSFDVDLPCDGTTVCGWSYSTSVSIKPGRYTVSVQALDRAGNLEEENAAIGVFVL